MSTGKVETNPTKGVRVCTWEGLAENEAGDAFFCGDLDLLTVSVTGTFSSETLTWQGSMDGANWFSLSDANDNAAAAYAAAGLTSLVERPLYIRPSVGTGGGAGTVDLDAIVSGVDLQ